MIRVLVPGSMVPAPKIAARRPKGWSDPEPPSGGARLATGARRKTGAPGGAPGPFFFGRGEWQYPGRV